MKAPSVLLTLAVVAITSASAQNASTQSPAPPARSRVVYSQELTIGPVTIPDALVQVNNGRISVRQKCYSADSDPLLNGIVLRYENGDTAYSTMRRGVGLSLFTGGSLISQLRDTNSPELVFRHDGSLEGSILYVDDAKLMLRKKDGSTVPIDLGSISYIRSPRAFVFNMSGSQAQQKGTNLPAIKVNAQSVSFQPTTSAQGISLSSVVLPKRDPLADLDNDDVPLFNPNSSGIHIRDDGSFAPAMPNTARPFPNWP